MAKRKQDPEELPDAPESKGKDKKKDNESDSDEVRRISPAYMRLRSCIDRTWTW